MEFSIDRESFSKGLNAVQRAVANRGPLPILSNVLIDARGDSLRIAATDLEVGIEILVPARTENSGAITIPARRLSEIVSKLPNSEIRIVRQDGERALLNCARSRFVIPGLTAAEFPAMPNGGDKNVFIDGQHLAKVFRQTEFATSDDTKSVISGVNIHISEGVLEVASTDGYRLARAAVDVDFDGVLTMVIPGKAVAEVVRLIGHSSEKVVFSTAKNQVVFQIGDSRLSSRLVDGNFPNYQQIIPKSFDMTPVVDRLALKTAVERVSIMANEREAKIVSFVFNPGELSMKASSMDLGESTDQIEIDYQGAPIGVNYNAQYLLDGLKAIEGETVTFNLNAPLMPAMLTSAEDALYEYLLMPIRS